MRSFTFFLTLICDPSIVICDPFHLLQMWITISSSIFKKSNDSPSYLGLYLMLICRQLKLPHFSHFRTSSILESSISHRSLMKTFGCVEVNILKFPMKIFVVFSLGFNFQRYLKQLSYLLCDIRWMLGFACFCKLYLGFNLGCKLGFDPGLFRSEIEEGACIQDCLLACRIQDQYWLIFAFHPKSVFSVCIEQGWKAEWWPSWSSRIKIATIMPFIPVQYAPRWKVEWWSSWFEMVLGKKNIFFFLLNGTNLVLYI